MAKRITQLSSYDTPIATDVLPIVDVTTGQTKKITFGDLIGSALSGWVHIADTWTYASSTTATVPSDATTAYSPGMMVRYVQGGSTKYGYITAVASTTLTINGGSDYTIANSAISDVYVSTAAAPYGFPHWFNWSPSFFTGFSANPSGKFRFMIKGRTVTIMVNMTSTGTSNATNFRLGLPVAASSTTNVQPVVALPIATDNGSESTTNDRAFIDPTDPSSLRFSKNNSQTGWTASGNKSASIGGFAYEF